MFTDSEMMKNEQNVPTHGKGDTQEAILDKDATQIHIQINLKPVKTKLIVLEDKMVVISWDEECVIIRI